jgi:AIR synthase-related protein
MTTSVDTTSKRQNDIDIDTGANASFDRKALIALADHLRQSRGFAHKHDIGAVVGTLGQALAGGAAALDQAVGMGDDCAAMADGDGYLLFAIEGLVEEFVERMPWFAGWCSVMVNVSDIYAMGGRPLAIVDALWSHGMDPARDLLQGMAAASTAYGVPIVGGHSNNRSDRGQLAVAIMGRARQLLSSFEAREGDRLVMAIDLRGAYQEPYSYWNAATTAPAERLRADLEILPWLAESGLCRAGKDISMAGAIGTTMMMLECSKRGAEIDLSSIPRPAGVALEKWLTTFPSYGFVLSVAPEKVGQVLQAFAERDISAAEVGSVRRGTQIDLSQGGHCTPLWDFAEMPFITARPHDVDVDVDIDAKPTATQHE